MTNLPSKHISFLDTSLNWDALVDSTRKNPDTHEKLFDAVQVEISARMSIDFGTFSDFENRKVDSVIR
ncbi:MAG: hypothetical protein K2X77_30135 [Candidatus Obscuribacterales bacterium]|jgi:hypothetical protein|nr:hypothetical protein [Candidatus Obscuribacterales bacterium]